MKYSSPRRHQNKSSLSGLCYGSRFGGLSRYIIPQEPISIPPDIPRIMRLDHLQASAELLCNLLGVGTDRQHHGNMRIPGVVERSEPNPQDTQHY